MSDLFAAQVQGRSTALGPQARVLHGFALPFAEALLAGIDAVLAAAPLRHLVTPGGHVMQVAMSNCGRFGWCSDRRGYRYDPNDPQTARPWPAFPPAFLALAGEAAEAAGFPGYRPDACLLNRYAPGTRLSLHQDRDEDDRVAPIVSVSLGLPATFLFGGFARGDKTVRVPLMHGDVVVWGGADRMRFHGVLPVSPGLHPATGECRLNLTFRKVR
ncbi:DNA oxidative demethylase AlkB [Thermomonas fusca]|uniref:DNA oxidative demethylase AlkB n=1 Tax=Thermomonas fusca TaxID=215690 RepID=A0A5R9PCQ1_9GAMM|nr:DNA oxidative demethylase AlkB [Thermomonas fusca]TLX21152.1 DNA oxidative demethylase AlkB [Thermomonas fusca]